MGTATLIATGPNTATLLMNQGDVVQDANTSYVTVPTTNGGQVSVDCSSVMQKSLVTCFCFSSFAVCRRSALCHFFIAFSHTNLPVMKEATTKSQKQNTTKSSFFHEEHT